MKYLKACLLGLTAQHATRSRHPAADFDSLQHFREDHKDPHHEAPSKNTFRKLLQFVTIVRIMTPYDNNKSTITIN